MKCINKQTVTGLFWNVFCFLSDLLVGDKGLLLTMEMIYQFVSTLKVDPPIHSLIASAGQKYFLLGLGGIFVPKHIL